MGSILQINARSVQDMHIYADPSCIPVVRIEQHVMVVPQHGSSKDLTTTIIFVHGFQASFSPTSNNY